MSSLSSIQRFGCMPCQCGAPPPRTSTCRTLNAGSSAPPRRSSSSARQNDLQWCSDSSVQSSDPAAPRMGSLPLYSLKQSPIFLWFNNSITCPPPIYATESGTLARVRARVRALLDRCCSVDVWVGRLTRWILCLHARGQLLTVMPGFASSERQPLGVFGLFLEERHLTVIRWLCRGANQDSSSSMETGVRKD